VEFSYVAVMGPEICERGLGDEFLEMQFHSPPRRDRNWALSYSKISNSEFYVQTLLPASFIACHG
jgi:hypothetical protein